MALMLWLDGMMMMMMMMSGCVRLDDGMAALQQPVLQAAGLSRAEIHCVNCPRKSKLLPSHVKS
jgi:hypothetical protein